MQDDGRPSHYRRVISGMDDATTIWAFIGMVTAILAGIGLYIREVPLWCIFTLGFIPSIVIVVRVYSAVHRERVRLRLPLVNPRFHSDLSALDGKWLIDAVIGHETVLIVIGDTIIAELLDRQTAARLRDEIDKRGGGHKKRRGIIVTSATLKNSRNRWNGEILEQCPLICIGGKENNDATQELESLAETKNTKPFPVGAGHAIFLKENGVNRAAIWGHLAKETESAVMAYIERPKGLSDFLKNPWNGHT